MSDLEGSPQSAIAFESFRNVYPESDYFERVTYWLGRCYLHLNETAKASAYFKNIAVTSPYSYYGILSKVD